MLVEETVIHATLPGGNKVTIPWHSVESIVWLYDSEVSRLPDGCIVYTAHYSWKLWREMAQTIYSDLGGKER